MKLLSRILCLTVLILTIAVNAGDIIGSIMESVAWAALREMIISDGHTKDYADCYIKLLKWQNVGDDVTDIRTLFDQDHADMLKLKLNVADYVCSVGGPLVCLLILLAIVVAFSLIVKIIKCCCE